MKELRSLRALFILTAALITGALLSLLVPSPNSLFGITRITASSGTSALDVSSGRLDMWTEAWGAILERPLFGYGAGQYFAVVPGVFNHPHNILLQLLFQWGFVGAICYLCLATSVIWHAIRALRSPKPADGPAVLVAVSLLTMSLYEGSLFHSYPIMMIALAFALIIAPFRPSVSFSDG